jgi:hypothetical protein
MRAWVLVGSLAFGTGAAAQGFPGQEPKSAAPVRSGTEPSPSLRHPTPDRNQFNSGAMPIQIEGAGLAVPAGVERDSPYSPPPLPVPASTPAKPPATVK